MSILDVIGVQGHFDTLRSYGSSQQRCVNDHFTNKTTATSSTQHKPSARTFHLLHLQRFCDLTAFCFGFAHCVFLLFRNDSLTLSSLINDFLKYQMIVSSYLKWCDKNRTLINTCSLNETGHSVKNDGHSADLNNLSLKWTSHFWCSEIFFFLSCGLTFSVKYKEMKSTFFEGMHIVRLRQS